jgi:hypothetical protein
LVFFHGIGKIQIFYGGINGRSEVDISLALCNS